jgi:hypothetical protein
MCAIDTAVVGTVDENSHFISIQGRQEISYNEFSGIIYETRHPTGGCLVGNRD